MLCACFRPDRQPASFFLLPSPFSISNPPPPPRSFEIPTRHFGPSRRVADRDSLPTTTSPDTDDSCSQISNHTTPRWVNHGQHERLSLSDHTLSRGNTHQRSCALLVSTCAVRCGTWTWMLTRLATSQPRTYRMAQQPPPAQHDQGRAMRNWVRTTQPLQALIRAGARLSMHHPTTIREQLPWLTDVVSPPRAALCQVFDSIFGDLPMSRVKFNVNTEYAYIQNFKILQS